jgi:hypothetical protein
MPLSYAQKELFKIIPNEQISLNPNEQKLCDYFKSTQGVQLTKFVEILDFDSRESMKHFTFTLPDEKIVLEAQEDQLDYRGDKQYTYAAKILDSEQGDGTMSIIRSSEGFGGYFQYKTGYEAIIPINEKIGLMLRFDLKSETVGCLQEFVAKEDGKPVYPKCLPPTICTKTLDVVCLVSANVASFFGNNTFQSTTAILILAKNAKIQTNQILANSLVYGKVRVRVVGAPNINITPIANPTFPNIAANIINSTPADSNAINAADIICVLTPYSGLQGYAGMSISSQFFALDIKYLLGPNFTFAHELGHCLGADHDYGDPCSNPKHDGTSQQGEKFPPTTPVCAHAHFWAVPINKVESKGYGTVMVNGQRGAKMIPYFSTPLVSWNGILLSDGANCEYNANVVQNGLCAASGNQPNPEMKVGLTSTPTQCGGTFTLNVLTSPTLGKPPFTYKWEWCSNNYFNNPVLIPCTTETLTLLAPLSCSFYYIRGTAYSSDGLEASILSYKINNSWCKSCFSPNGLASDDIDVFPNPAFNSLTIHWIKSNGSASELSIFDEFGKAVHNSVCTLKEAENETEIDVSNIESGLYYLKIEQENNTITKRIFILH